MNLIESALILLAQGAKVYREMAQNALIHHVGEAKLEILPAGGEGIERSRHRADWATERQGVYAAGSLAVEGGFLSAIS